MKRLLSLFLCLSMIFSVVCISSANAFDYDTGYYYDRIVFVDENTFYINKIDTGKRDSDNVGFYDEEWYRIVDGVVYGINYDWHENEFHAAIVEAILVDDPEAKVTIGGSIDVIDYDKVVSLPVIVNINPSYRINVGEIEIGDGVTSIKGIDGNNLKKITLGKDVCEIENCFNYCTNLEVVIDEENPYLEMDENSIYYVEDDYKRLMTVINPPEHYEIKDDVTSYHKAISSSNTTSIKINGNLKDLTLGEGYIKRIDFSENVDTLKVLDISFSRVKKLDLSNIKKKMEIFNAQNAKKLNSIVLPEKLKKIEDFGFSGTKKLQTIEIPDSILALNTETFSGSGITKIKLSENLKRISYKAFKNCKNLKKVIFRGDKLRKIRDDAFKGTPSGIKFYTPDTKTAKKLKNKLAGTGVKKAKIYANNKLIYKNVK